MDAVSRITPAPNVGDRLVIRYRLPDGSATDVLGELVAEPTEQIAVRTRDDRLVTVDRSTVIVAKVVPTISRGPDPLRIPADELEQAAAASWVAYAERLGSWWLRAAGGFTGRANSCLAVGDPGVPFDQAARRIVEFADEHRIPAMAQVISGSAEETGLRELGWIDTYLPTDVLAQRLSELGLSELGRRTPDPRVTVEERLTDSWWDAYQSYRPNDADPELLQTLLTNRPPVGLAGIGDGNRLIAIGRGQVSDRWLGVAALWTAPDRRQRGLATAILIGLVHWAARKDARNVYLQVAQENAAAHQAYERLGFRHHHTYRYLRP